MFYIIFFVGLAFGYTLGGMHWESFFPRLLFRGKVHRIVVALGEGGVYEVALHCGRKKRVVERVVCKTVRDGLVTHLHDRREWE